MEELNRVVVRVVSQKGYCTAGHKDGDEFEIEESTPLGMCSWAFAVVFPFSQVLKFGGAFPWEEDRDRATVACPDPDNPVVFELRRYPG